MFTTIAAAATAAAKRSGSMVKSGSLAGTPGLSSTLTSSMVLETLEATPITGACTVASEL
jgi:hypothetical protein